MKTVGEILKRARKERGIDLAKVEAGTKIKKKFLRAIEKNDFKALPSEVAARGFIKNYAEFLGLSSVSVLAFFKRDFRLSQEKKLVSPKLDQPINEPNFHWTPKLTLFLAVGLTFLILAIWLAYQYFSLSGRANNFLP